MWSSLGRIEQVSGSRRLARRPSARLPSRPQPNYSRDTATGGAQVTSSAVRLNAELIAGTWRELVDRAKLTSDGEIAVKHVRASRARVTPPTDPSRPAAAEATTRHRRVWAHHCSGAGIDPKRGREIDGAGS